MSSNRLSSSASPYLRQHAENPVHWQPWDKAAFEEARSRNVPIHLSIGYAACHWCHVMAHESFENPDIAALMNEHFVNIKVDREERPDVDQIYMRALHGLGEQGGWPLTMFLSPDGKPFWGGTYFPPEPRWGRPGFPQVLSAMNKAWQNDDAAVTNNGDALFDMLESMGSSPDAGTGKDLSRQGIHDLLDRAARRISEAWDMDEGGFKGAPKFPQAPVLDLLSRAYLRTGDATFERALTAALNGLCSGGIYDHIGGGFSRYSVDQHWLVPHFEKMLSDNGQLLYLLAIQSSRHPNPFYAQKIEETIAWLVRDMRLEGGAFAASLDADTLGEEGLTYVWNLNEIKEILPTGEAEIFCRHYDITQEGNFEGKSIPNRLATSVRGWLGQENEEILAGLRKTALEIRSKRPQPGRDGKVITDWNAVTIVGLVEAGQRLERSEWIDVAETAYRFILNHVRTGNRLAHTWCDGRVTAPGFATDYAQMIRAGLALYGATGNDAYLHQAETWIDQINTRFWDEASSSYRLAADDADDIIVRPPSLQDEAMPSATGVMAQNLATIHLLTGRSADAEKLDRILKAQMARIESDIVSTASLQSAVDTTLRGRTAIQVSQEGGGAALNNAIMAEADPALFRLTLNQLNDLPENNPAYGKSLGEAESVVYICRAGQCYPPVTNAPDAETLLLSTRSD